MIVQKGSKVAVVEQIDVEAAMSVSEEPPAMPKKYPQRKEKQGMLWQVVEKSVEKLSEL